MNLFAGLTLRPFLKAFDLLHSAGYLGSQGSAAELHKAVVNAAILLLGLLLLQFKNEACLICRSAGPQ